MAIIENLLAFVANLGFIGGAIVVLAIIGGILWWMFKRGKLPFKLPI